MPRKASQKCYFGCVRDEGPLHHFPKGDYRDAERFNKWLSVLDPKTRDKGADYITNTVTICHRHFDDIYKLPSRRLTRNAIPTLNISFNRCIQPLDTVPTAIYNTQPSTSTSNTQAAHSGPKICQDRPKQGIIKTINHLKEKITKMRQYYKRKNRELLIAKRLNSSKIFTTMLQQLPEASQTLFKMQMQRKRNPRGRRFTTKEKIMALSIFKQSPKTYNILKTMFILPSKRSLQKLLSAFNAKPGIDNAILKSLKNVADKLPEEKKLVNLLFDEVALAPSLFYNDSKNEIVGFEDFGFKKTKFIADHALVFMIKSIKCKKKQPICFTFCQSATKKDVLKTLLTKIIKEINNSGLTIVATICDQCSTNTSVIKNLVEETNIKYRNEGKLPTTCFEIENSKVFPLYDTPHLLKGVRNNLLTKNAIFVQNNKEKIANWEHLQMLLEVDVGEDEIRLVNKLTENHIKKEKIKKMKVKLAAQVFSQRVSSALRFLSRHNILPAECEDTADFLLIFDKLFDSFNGHSYQDTSKLYKGCIKNNSMHFKLWDDLLPILESIKFKSVVRKNGVDLVKFVSVPSIKNWVQNIKTFKEMFQHLYNHSNVRSLLTRNFNQDPLENFFSNIRSHGVRNVNPTCNQFVNAFKTLIINNFNSPHSVNANCEQDFNQTIQSINHLLNYKCDDSQNVDYACNIEYLVEVMNEIKSNDSLLHVESKKYVTGYIIKKSKLKIFKKCRICLNDLCKSEVDYDSFNYEVDYTKKSLFHPNDKFIHLMNEMYYVIVACLRNNPESVFLKNIILFSVDSVCDFSILTCINHKVDLRNFISNHSIKLIVHSWCLGVNRIINGKLLNFDKNDSIKKQAYDIYIKRNKK